MSIVLFTAPWAQVFSLQTEFHLLIPEDGSGTKKKISGDKKWSRGINTIFKRDFKKKSKRLILSKNCKTAENFVKGSWKWHEFFQKIQKKTLFLSKDYKKRRNFCQKITKQTWFLWNDCKRDMISVKGLQNRCDFFQGIAKQTSYLSKDREKVILLKKSFKKKKFDKVSWKKCKLCICVHFA